MDNSCMRALTYGLFVVTAKENGFDNGCITNTVQQVTTSPNMITLAVNKANHTHGMIMRTGEFCVSIISEKADFEVFKRFGFQSGANVNKFEGYSQAKRAENGLYYITEGTNAYICAKVVSTVDFPTHTLFIAEVTYGQTLTKDPSATYAYYHSSIKPQPQKATKTVWRCSVCGYEYEGEELPDDFTCPWCKHGKEDFVKVTVEK
ncbi:MAG: flavin reductase [Candidatus Coproplasma sp.]